MFASSLFGGLVVSSAPLLPAELLTLDARATGWQRTRR